MSGSTRVHKRSRRPCMPEYSSESWTLRLNVCICICEAYKRYLSMELSVMKIIGVDFIVVWIFCSFNDAFISSYTFKMFWNLIGLLSNYHNRYLRPSGEFSVHVSDCDETLWRAWRYLSCVSCVCAFGSEVSLSFSRCAGSWFVLRFVSLFHVDLCFNVGCLVFCVYRSFCVFVFWHLVMSSPVCAWSLIGHCGWICYLILSLQIRYHLWCLCSVCLSCF